MRLSSVSVKRQYFYEIILLSPLSFSASVILCGCAVGDVHFTTVSSSRRFRRPTRERRLARTSPRRHIKLRSDGPRFCLTSLIIQNGGRHRVRVAYPMSLKFIRRARALSLFLARLRRRSRYLSLDPPARTSFKTKKIKTVTEMKCEPISVFKNRVRPCPAWAVVN